MYYVGARMKTIINFGMYIYLQKINTFLFFFVPPSTFSLLLKTCHRSNSTQRGVFELRTSIWQAMLIVPPSLGEGASNA